MIIRLVLSSATFVALIGCSQTPAVSPQPVRLAPLVLGSDGASTAPQQAPQGRLCLVQRPEPCGAEAELVRKPYEGGGSLYYLENSKQADGAESPPPSLNAPTD